MAAQDLTTLTAAREFLQKPAGDIDQDALVSSLITRASDTINRNYYRFLPAETAASKTFVWRGGPLALWPYLARTVTAVTLDSDQTTTTALTVADWRLRPKPAPDGVYRWLRFPSYGSHNRIGAETEVTVVGDWGFANQAAVPEDVEHWAIATVAAWLRGGAQTFSTTFRLDDERLERPEALPSAVRAGLARWKHPELP